MGTHHTAPHREWITTQLEVPVTVANRPRNDHHVDVYESAVQRYIAATFAHQRLQEILTVPRGAVEPGNEAQIDYGKLGMWFSRALGSRISVWAFVMILA